MFWAIAIAGLLTGITVIVVTAVILKMIATHRKHVEDAQFMKQIRDNAEAARRIIKKRTK